MNEYEVLHNFIRRKGGWSLHPRTLIPHLGHTATAILMWLIDLHKSKGDWILITSAFIQNGMCLNEEAGNKWLIQLKTKGLIEIKYEQGRYVRVNCDAVKRLIEGKVMKTLPGFNFKGEAA